MDSVRLAVLAKFLHLQSIFQSFLVFLGKIIYSFAAGAFQLDHIILRHKSKNQNSKFKNQNY